MDIDKLLEEPSRRRAWLLIKALECTPLDNAIVLARAADRFVIGDEPMPDQADSKIAVTDAAPEASPPGIEAHVAGGTPMPVLASAKPSRLPLAPSDRHQLLARAASGASNRELAAAFGLKPRQVQAIRMVAARSASSRKSPLQHTEGPRAAASAPLPASIEEIVRYLRQRDDVVVPAGDGTFLVNGRFRLGLAELIAKANRARERQNKPLFAVEGVGESEMLEFADAPYAHDTRPPVEH